MKAWFKHFGLSFFSHNIASESPKHGFVTVAVSLALAFVFFLLGYYCADVVPFSTHYGNATGYREFIDGAFGDIRLEVSGGKAVSDAAVNTYTDGSDARYAINGYNLIVDTRASNTYIRFVQTAEKGGETISYEQYLSLSETERAAYAVKTTYTDEALEMTEADVRRYTEYLDGITREGEDGYDADAAKKYEALKQRKDELAEDEYDKELYCLYVETYFTDVRSTVYGAKAPTLRDYYYNDYIANGKTHYLYIFDNMCAGSFETDGKLPVVFGGYLNKLPDGEITDIHKFITDAYYGTVGYTFASYFVSAMTLLPALVFIPLLLGLIMWGIGKGVKGKWEKTFVGCYKTVHSFVWVSALAASLIVFLLGFGVSARSLYLPLPFIYGGILLIRTIVHCAICAARKNKEVDGGNDVGNDKLTNEIFGGVL